MLPSSGEGRETPALLGPPRNVIVWLALSEGPNRVGACLRSLQDGN
jgi:hypothetical protein